MPLGIKKQVNQYEKQGRFTGKWHEQRDFRPQRLFATKEERRSGGRLTLVEKAVALGYLGVLAFLVGAAIYQQFH